MKIIILAHGKIKNGPEFDLIFDYVTRFNKQFNSDFLTSLEISESNESESQFYKKVSRILDSNQSTVLLDRNGEQIDSEGLTQLVTSFSEKGIRKVSFVIGGASGFPKQLTLKAKKIIAFLRWSFLTKLLDCFGRTTL